MAAADQQFLDALMYLGKQGQQLGIKYQMDDVNKRAEEIQNTMKDDIQKRQALRNLATTAQISVAGSGGNAQQISAIENLMPKVPTTIQSAYLQGSLTGDQQMVTAAENMMAREEAGKLRLLEKELAAKIRAESKSQDNFLAKEQIKAGIRDAGKYRGVIESQKELLAAYTHAKNLINESDLSGTGPLDQFIMTSHGERIKQALQDITTKARVAFAKVAGAGGMNSEGEMKALLDSLPKLSNWESSNLSILEDMSDVSTRAMKEAADKVYSYENTGFISGDAMQAPDKSSNLQGLRPRAGKRANYFDR